MEEFVERFTEFREWLYNRVKECESEDEEEIIEEIILKYEELQLHNDF